MDDPNRLDSIIKLADQKKSDAGRDLKYARNQQIQDQQQLKQLQDFYDEYLRQFKQATSIGMNARQLSDFRTFLNNLESAISQKNQQLMQADSRVEERRDEWRGKHQHSEMLADYQGKLSHQNIVKNTRREQKEVDDRPPGNSHSPR